MTRLKKELAKRGIIFDDSDSNDCYEAFEELFMCEKDFVITISGNAMMDPEFHIYDRNLELVAIQYCLKDKYYDSKMWENYFNPFGSYCNFE